MIREFGLIRRDPVLMMVTWGSFIFGAFACTAGIFQSLIAVTVFGISDGTYAVLLMVGLAASILAAVGVGIITDQRPSRRMMAILATLAMLAGGVLVAAGSNAVVFVIAHMLLFPVAGTIFGQLFAIARLVCAPMPRPDRDGVLAIIRAAFAMPFVVVLMAWGAAFEAGMPLVTVYPAIVVIGAILMALVAMRWPKDASAPWSEQKSGLGFRASLAEMTSPAVLIRVLLIGAIHSGSAITGVSLGLLFGESTARGAQDVALFFAAFVAIEVVVTLYIGQVRRWLRRLYIIAAGVFIYAVFMALLPQLVDGPALWWLIVPAGAGGAMVYALAIGYLQDLLGKRAGAGASLLAIQRLGSDGLSAAIFAIGTAISGYALVMEIGAFTICAAMVAILWLDRRQTDPL